MKLFNFQYGDEVRVTRTLLTGTILRTGGITAVVLIHGEYKQAVCYPLTRLRHVDSFGVLTLRRGKKKITQLTNKIKYEINQH
jgi:hypothetical protein